MQELLFETITTAGMNFDLAMQIHLLRCAELFTWAAWYNTWLLSIDKGVVFSCLFRAVQYCLQVSIWFRCLHFVAMWS